MIETLRNLTAGEYMRTSDVDNYIEHHISFYTRRQLDTERKEFIRLAKSLESAPVYTGDARYPAYYHTYYNTADIKRVLSPRNFRIMETLVITLMITD